MYEIKHLNRHVLFEAFISREIISLILFFYWTSFILFIHKNDCDVHYGSFRTIKPNLLLHFSSHVLANFNSPLKGYLVNFDKTVNLFNCFSASSRDIDHSFLK